MAQRIITVGVSPTVIIPRDRGHVNARAEVQVYNGSASTIYFGTSSDVTAGSGTPATAGLPLATGLYITFAIVNSGLWAITSAGTADINCLFIGIEDL